MLSLPYPEIISNNNSNLLEINVSYLTEVSEDLRMFKNGIKLTLGRWKKAFTMSRVCK
jgi:hypothetical protein